MTLSDRTEPEGPESERLLSLAAYLLEQAEFRTRKVLTPRGRGMLIAENPLFVLGIQEFTDLSDLEGTEPDGSLFLAEMLASAGGKRWDAYLVLLSQTTGRDTSASSTITEVVYNTRYLRRLVRLNVLPTEDHVLNALRPFFPLRSSRSAGPRDPVEMLGRGLVENGVAREGADAAIVQWRADERSEHA